MLEIKVLKKKLFNRTQEIQSLIQDQPITVAALVLCAGGFLAFSKLASEVVEGESHHFDTLILLMMRNVHDPSNPIGPRWFEEMMRDITGLGGVAVLTLITLSSALYLYIIKRKDIMLYLLTAVGTGTIFSNLLKVGFDRPRPDLVPHETITYTSSFPSGHSLVSAVVYLTLGALLAEAQPRYRLKVYILSLAILITFLVGISRIYLGVHWPSDVLAGWLGGSAWALMFWIISHYVNQSREYRLKEN